MRNKRMQALFAQYAKFRVENRQYFLFCDDILLKTQDKTTKFVVETLVVM